LKQKRVANETLINFLFPRLKKRGPIEAQFNPTPMGLPDKFPRLKKRGPIEARKNIINLFDIIGISALEKARPH